MLNGAGFSVKGVNFALSNLIFHKCGIYHNTTWIGFMALTANYQNKFDLKWQPKTILSLSPSLFETLH